METPRAIQLILSDLTVDILKHEDGLEKALNENVDINTKLINVKYYLKEMVLAEAMATKFQALMSQQSNTEQK